MTSADEDVVKTVEDDGAWMWWQCKSSGKIKGTGIATNKLPRHSGYPKEVGEILKTSLAKIEGTGIETTNLPRHFGYRK